MRAEEAYHWLTGTDASFETHVLASILALAIADAGARGGTIGEAAGYEGLPGELAVRFPHAAPLLAAAPALVRGDDEACVLDLLRRGASHGSALERLLAGMIARRAQCPNHLWQDLGLRHRGELSELMTVHFAKLARRNTSDMKWKKFFFRMICRDASYSLCTAPSCGECCDFDHCFGTEEGESFLAHLRCRVETP